MYRLPASGVNTRLFFSGSKLPAGKLRHEVTTGSLFYHLPSNQNSIFDRPASKIVHLCTKIRFFEVPRKRSEFSPSGKHDFPPAQFKLPLPSSWNLSSRGLSVILLPDAIPVLGDAVESTLHCWKSGEQDFQLPSSGTFELEFVLTGLNCDGAYNTFDASASTISTGLTIPKAAPVVLPGGC
ncbi:hypothetical protein C8R43DRAFT_953614 [Mycena crocata]|nr:hypothetical protein C8R43DRAFT_953614 [Mycena crocata]